MQIRDQLHDALSDRYDVEREIGAGGMATVYLARDLKHDRRVALKVLNPELGAVLGVERFLAEIKVTANLQHPNLLPLFDSGAANGLLFYVMPYVEGESLRARLEREKQLPIDEVVRISVAIAGALDYAHRNHVIHRDLKPENILLHEGQPLIADFGIALAVSNAGGNRITQTGLSLGTPQYMSPEQATGDRAIDGRTDIYSLGAMTYEMLTGDPPHTGSTAQAIIAHILTERPRSVRATRPNVPEQVEWAVQQALEKLPADRWSTAGQFADAMLGKVVTASGTTALRYGARGGPIGWRVRLRDPLVLTLGVAALGAIALAAYQQGTPRTGESAPVVRFELTLPEGVRTYVPNVGPGFALSPDGRTLAFIGSEAGGAQPLYIRTLDDPVPRALTGPVTIVRTPFFSPDNQWIGFWEGGRLHKVALNGGTTFPLATIQNPLGASWADPDEIVVSDGSQLLRVPANGGEPRALVEGPNDATNRDIRAWPVVLSDGETVLFASIGLGGFESSRIGVASLTTGATTVLDLGGAYPLGVVEGMLIYTSTAGTLLAVPFDVKLRRMLGEPMTVATNIVLTANGGARVALSQSGSLAYRSGSQASHMTLVDARGFARTLMDRPQAFSFPRFSPDGRKVAFTASVAARSDVWIYDVASGTQTRLTTEGTSNERAEWSHDGKRVLYRTDRSGPPSSIWWQPADLSGSAEPLLASARSSFFEAVISPDGRWVVYQLDTAGSDVMYRAVVGDTTPRIVSATRFNEDRARLSPDGRWVAFQTNESGTQQVVVQAFPVPGSRVQVSVNGGSEPIWGPDGRRLYYRDGEKIAEVTYRPSPTFTVVSRVALFDDIFIRSFAPHANYDISPNGSQFIFLKEVVDPKLFIAHNWSAELRAARAGQR